jgi:hypothetical protein
MKKFAVICGLCCSLIACGGGSDPDFSGTWNGSYTSLVNKCPFSVASDINPLFPMTVSIDGSNVFTVTAFDGSVAVGGQGQGEVISFLATASKFGNYGSISPYTCTSSLSTVGYLDAGDNKANVTLTVQFTGCVKPGDAQKKQFNCGAIYYGDATKVTS